MIAYLDASVVLRVVLGQRERLAEWKTIETGISSGLLEVECLRTLDRLKLKNLINDQDLMSRREAVFRLVDEIEIVEPTRAVLSRASQPLPTPMGTLDAIHLASALLWKERQGQDLVMATHDAALAMGSRACGLTVVGT